MSHADVARYMRAMGAHEIAELNEVPECVEGGGAVREGQTIADVLEGRADWIVTCADCLQVLPTIPAGSVGAVVTDPPYGVGFQYANHNDRRDEYLLSIPKWFAAFPCANIAITPGIVNVGYWPPSRWILAWMKTNSMGASFLSGPNAVSRNLWEPVLWYGTYPPCPPSRDIIHAPMLTGDSDTGHPCPKPVALMLALVQMAAKEDGVILDPFCGSGTTGVACIKTGRRFVGIEIDPGYADIARRRIREAEPVLFTRAKSEQSEIWSPPRGAEGTE